MPGLRDVARVPAGVPVGRGRAEHEPVDEVRVVAREEARDRADHRVARCDDALDVLPSQNRGGVVGAIAEAERRGTA
jgi:hypothetical protein